MQITRAIITAAAPSQRTLPLQSLVDRDGTPKSALSIVVEEILQAGVRDICVVVSPGDQQTYARAAGSHAGGLQFVEQSQPLGYGHAVLCADRFAGQEPFLLLVADHLYLSDSKKSCARQLIDLAISEACAVSAVQSTHESKLPFYGSVSGRLVSPNQRLYQIENVLEKPTPTEAEQKLIVPGLRAGHYLCFFGMHVLTPVVMEFLSQELAGAGDQGGIHLSPALARLAKSERYLAAELAGRRFDIGARYGLLIAQLALAMDGADRDEVLTSLVELLAHRHK